MPLHMKSNNNDFCTKYPSFIIDIYLADHFLRDFGDFWDYFGTQHISEAILGF